MLQIYTSPRQENIDNVVALMAEHGIEASVSNRSNYNRPTWQRLSYSQRRGEDRSNWPQVWVTRADDHTRARALLRGMGIEPVIRHAEELAAERNPPPIDKRRRTAALVRRFLLVAVLVVFAVQMLRRYLHVF